MEFQQSDNIDLPASVSRILEGEKVIFSLSAQRIYERSDYLPKIIFGCLFLYFFLSLQIAMLFSGSSLLAGSWKIDLSGLILKLIQLIPGLMSMIGFVALSRGLKLRNLKDIPVAATESRILMLVNGNVKIYPWSCFSGNAAVLLKRKGIKLLLSSDPTGAKAKKIYFEGPDDPEMVASTCLRLIQKAGS